jgi:hypothetical protein
VARADGDDLCSQSTTLSQYPIKEFSVKYCAGEQ